MSERAATDLGAWLKPVTVPSGWAWTTLGEVSEKPQYGWTTKANHDVDGLKLLRTTDITAGFIDWQKVPSCTDEPPDREKYLLMTDDIVVSRAGSVGASIRVISPPPAVFASYLIRLRAVGVEPAYVSWYLRSPRYWGQVRDAAAGIALLNVNAKKLAAISLPLPPLNEQRRIVAAIEEHLSRLDAADVSLVSGLRRLSLVRDSIVRSVDGDFPKIPLADVATVASGQTPKGLETSPAGSIPYYKVGDMNAAEGRRMARARAYVTEAEASRAKLRVYPVGTVVFPKRGGAIATNKKRILTIPAAVDLNTMALVPGDEIVPEFLLAYLETVDLASLSDGSNVPQINHGDIAPLEIPVPPLEEQRRIVAEIEERLGAIDALRAAIERAQRKGAALRRLILERAFRGELVPQDPSDEPASVLLDRIRAERAAIAVRPVGR